MASDKQLSFVTSLVSQRWRGLQMPSLDEGVKAVLGQLDGLDTRATSVVIDRLKMMPVDPDPDVPEYVSASGRFGVNNNKGVCTACGGLVEARAGYYYRANNGGWDISHKVGQCVEGTGQEPINVTPGVYILGDDVICIYMTQYHNLGGQRLDVETGRFVYESGLVQAVRLGGRPATWEEAALYGKMVKRCCVCRRSLTDDGEKRSVEVGYGPKCAENQGWPWG